jgi:hypothetical protein
MTTMMMIIMGMKIMGMVMSKRHFNDNGLGLSNPVITG